MPQRPDLFVPIVQADPSFGPAWEAFRHRWSGEAELPMHLAATMLARHLIAKLANNDTGAFPAIFAVVEEWLSHPDRYVRRVADVGLIEDLQSTRFHTNTSPADFQKWLGPKATAAWLRTGTSWLERDAKEGLVSS
jgi:hypothetical protein